MSGYALRFETPATIKQAAAEKGCDVRFPAPNELFIDLDSGLEQFTELFSIFQQTYPNTKVQITPSRSRQPGHHHAIVTLDRPVRDDVERVCLQSLLGSDPKRELLAYLKLEASGGTCVSSVLFVRPPV